MAVPGGAVLLGEEDRAAVGRLRPQALCRRLRRHQRRILGAARPLGEGVRRRARRAPAAADGLPQQSARRRTQATQGGPVRAGGFEPQGQARA